MPKRHEHPTETYQIKLEGHELNLALAALECYAQAPVMGTTGIMSKFNTAPEIRRRSRALIKKLNDLWG